jgi:hypothetical protein
MKQLIIEKNRMFVQVLTEKKRRRRRRRRKNAHLKRFIWLFSFFLRHTYDRYKIVDGNAEKSCLKPIALACLANKRCQRPAERERDKYQKMTEKQQKQANSSIVDR